MEPVVLANGTIGTVLRNVVIAEVRDVPTRRQAQALLDEKLRGLNQGSHRPQAIVTFKEFVEEHWEQKLLPTFKPSTSDVYRILLRKHLLPYFGEMHLCDIGRADVQAFVVEKDKAGLSWNSVKHLRNLVSRILRTAEEWSYVSTNAARGARLPAKQLSPPPKVLTPEQVRALLE